MMTNSKRTKLSFALAAALGVAAASADAAQMTLYARSGFQGKSMTTTTGLSNLPRSSFDDLASSAIVGDGTWEACTEVYYRGRCAQIVPGNYGDLGAQLNGLVASVRLISEAPVPAGVVLYPDRPTVAINPVPAPVVVNPAPAVVSSDRVVVTTPVVTGVPIPAGARATLYQHTGHLTRVVELTASIDDLDRRNFDDSADAALISGGVWRLCDRERGRGACADFSPGKYDTLGALSGRVRSAYLIAPVQERVATVAAVPPGRAIVYEFPNYGGAPAVIEYGRAPDMDWAYFKNPAASLRIESGSWLVCSDIGYQGECRVLEPGNYPVLTGLGLRGIASARQVWRPEYGSMDLHRLSTP